MTLAHISDANLLGQIRGFTVKEREVVVKILHHLREIERRKLYADLGYRSLFDYMVSDLKYSEGQASRRIAAMRLIKDLPEVEAKISSGELSLSNAQKAQSYFRELQTSEPLRILSKSNKLDVLTKLENKSVREGQKELLKLHPAAALPKERERLVGENISEVKFLVSDQLKIKLEEVRSLLGSRGASMSYAELMDAMSDLSIEALKEKRFGKKRVKNSKVDAAPDDHRNDEKAFPKLNKIEAIPPTPSVKSSNPRYISRSIKHAVWNRDGGRCSNCRGKNHLNYDHVQPVALYGKSTIENLRLLCFSCNQRANVKTFGYVYRPEQRPE